MRSLVIAFVFATLISSQNLTGQNLELQFDIYSNILNENRTCFVQLPASYYNGIDDDYPILILLDGLTFFKTATGITHFMSSNRNRNYSMPETIIIAIENVDRERDFTFTKLKTKRANTMGGGKTFLEFIEKELIPYVDKAYRTISYKTLVGHSLGGQFVLNTYLNGSTHFDTYLSIDPSLWWGDQDVIQSKVNAINPSSFNKKLYIATANQVKSRFEKNKKRHDYLYKLLVTKSNQPKNIMIETFDDENHRSVPLIAIYKGLKFLNQDH